MLRKPLLALAILLLLPALAAAYTVILKDGRRFEAREKYVFVDGMIQFVGADGQLYRFAASELDFEATTRANAPALPAAGRIKITGHVWTNDDLERLPPTSRINVLGQAAPIVPASAAAPSPAEQAQAPEALPREKDPKYWQERIQKVRQELARVEEQIRSLQSNLGRTSAGINLMGTNLGVQPADTLRQLERRRQELLQQITQIEDEARRAGMPPGVLR